MAPVARTPAGGRWASNALAHGAPAADTVDLNAVDDRRVALGCAADLGCCGQPPFEAALKQLPDALPHVCLLRFVADLFVPPEDEHGRPRVLCLDILELDADLRILAHPVNFLTDGREAIQTAPDAVVGQMHGDQVWLFVVAAGQPRERRTREDLDALRLAQFVNAHDPRV